MKEGVILALFYTHYQIKQFWHNCFLFFSNSVNVINTDDPQYSDYDIIICDIIDDDLDFLEDLMKKHGKNWSSFSILSHTCSDKAAKLINEWIGDYFETRYYNCCISISLAIQREWNERFKIGTFTALDGGYSSSGLNAGTLLARDYRTIIPYAKEIAWNIKLLGLPCLEQIIWIDNWMQQNIQYIKDRETTAGGQVFVCDDISKQAIVTDVFTYHRGVCEDISASIAAILYFLDIPFEVVQGGGHAWLLVKVDQAYYLWDCTHNITRNPQKVHEALKAKAYSYAHTLMGQDTYENKYSDFSELGLTANKHAIGEERITNSIKLLSGDYGVQFFYGDNCPYASYIKKCQNDL